jgi:hypothetical protein
MENRRVKWVLSGVGTSGRGEDIKKGCREKVSPADEEVASRLVLGTSLWPYSL